MWVGMEFFNATELGMEVQIVPITLVFLKTHYSKSLFIRV